MSSLLKSKFKQTSVLYGSVDIKELLDIADGYTAVPTSEISNIFEGSIREAGRGVAGTFFKKSFVKAIWADTDFTTDRDELAVELVSVSMSKVNSFKFNETTNSSEAETKWKAIIQGDKGVKMGQALVIQELVKNHGFQKYLDDKEDWVAALETILLDKTYVTGTIVKQLEQQVSLPSSMKLLFLQELGSTKFEDVHKFWVSCSSEELIQPCVDFVTTENHLQFEVANLEADPFANEVQAACMVKTTSQRTEHVNPITSDYDYTYIYTTTTYGGSVASWLNSSDGPKAFGVRTGTKPTNSNTVMTTPSSGMCFLADTQIFIKEGAIPIQSLSQGISILGANGNFGTTSSEVVRHVIEESVPLFGFNGNGCFFVGSHAFWTQHGWRSVNPYMSKLENAWADVGQLVEGDYLRKLVGYDQMSNSYTYRWEKIVSIDYEMVSGGTSVYGVHTREGPRSYHANGYLVMENYPEITSESMRDGTLNLEPKYRKKMHRELYEMEPLLTKMLGADLSSILVKNSEGFSDGTLSFTSKKNSTIFGVPFKEVSIPELSLKPTSGLKATGSYEAPKTLSVDRGHLFVDDVQVEDVQILNDNTIAWTRPVVDSNWEHGALKLHSTRLSGVCQVYLTNEINDTSALLSTSFVAGSSINKYSCFRSKQALPPDNQSMAGITISDWEDFGELQMGDTCDTVCHVIGHIQLPSMDKPDYLDGNVTFSTDKHNQLNVIVVVPMTYRSIIGYSKLTGVFSWDYKSFSGYCIAYKPGAEGFDGDKFSWRGDVQVSGASTTMGLTSRETALSSDVHVQKQPIRTIPFTTLTNAENYVDTAPTNMMIQAAQMASDNLDIQELIQMTPPDNKSVSDLAFSYLQTCMKYAMPDDLRNNLLGVVKPNLTGVIKEVADKYHDFFASPFCNGFLMNILKSSKEVGSKITKEQQNKLLYFWAGNDDGCVTRNKDYNLAYKQLSREAYIGLCPQLVKYIDSPEGGPSWGKKLYEYLIQPDVITGIAYNPDIDEANRIQQKQSMVLFCLAPDADYGSQFYLKLITKKLEETGSFFSGGTKVETSMKEIITAAIRRMIEMAMDPNADPDNQMLQVLKELLPEVVEELGITDESFNLISSRNSSLPSLDSIMKSLQKSINQLVEFYNEGQGSWLDKLTAGMKKWSEANPKLISTFKFLGDVFTLANSCMNLFTCVELFMRWDKLTWEQKTQLIINTVNTTIKIMSSIGKMIADAINAVCAKGKTSMEFAQIWSKYNNGSEVVNEVLNEGVEMTSMGEDTVAEAIGEVAGRNVTEGAAPWTASYFAEIAEGFVKILGVLACVGACVAIGFKIYEDFANGETVPVKVFDIISGVVSVIALGAAIIGLFVTAAAIPVIGTVCAVLGILIMFIELFLPKKAKPTPAETYIDTTGSDFVDPLKAPTQEWLDDYHKKHDT